MIEEIKKDAIFYERSGGKGAYIHTALDTCGHTEWWIYEEVLKSVDLLLYDFKHMDPVKHKWYTGISNRLMLDNVRRASHKLSIPVWTRKPVIPGYNDSDENIQATARFIAKELANGVKWGSLLPYHRLVETKFERPEANYALSTSPPGQGHLQELQRVFDSFGLPAYIGG